MLSYKDGNIFESNCDIIVHQTNCQGVMGHGIALQVKQRYPEVFQQYKISCDTAVNKEYLLGEVEFDKTNDNKYIASIFGQLYYGEGLQTDYFKLEKGLNTVHDFALENKLTVAIPYKIGCGLAHGDWNLVNAMIETIFKESPVECYVYKFERNEKY